MSAIASAFLQAANPPYKPPNPRGWTTTNKWLAATAGAGLVGDWLQTLDIARTPDARRTRSTTEMNPILGPSPSVGRVNTYFGAAALGSGLLAHVLPPKYRNIFLGALSALEVGNVVRNKALGLKFNFRF